MLGIEPEYDPLVNPDPVYSNTNNDPVSPLLLLFHKDWEYLISDEATLADAVGIPAVLNLNWHVWGTSSVPGPHWLFRPDHDELTKFVASYPVSNA